MTDSQSPNPGGAHEDRRACCPYCSFPVSGEAVTLWDGRAYCRKCVDEVSPVLYEFVASGARLEETLDRRDVSALRYVMFLGKWYLAGVALIFGLPLGLMCLAGMADVLALVFALGFFGGCGLLFLFLQAELGAFVLRRGMPRTVSVENGQFVIKTKKEEARIPLADCKWYLYGVMADQVCWFTGLRRGIVIWTSHTHVAIGHAPELLDHWRAFLTLARISHPPTSGCLWYLAAAAAGMLGGGAVGVGVGYGMSIATSNPVWPFVLGFLGVVEGPVLALNYVAATFANAETRQRLHPAVFGISFFILGAWICMIGGDWPTALVCGAVNGLIGALVGWLCRLRIRAAETEQELSDHLRA